MRLKTQKTKTIQNSSILLRRNQPYLAADARITIGIDIGSISSDIVVTDACHQILFTDYKRTQGKPLEVVYKQLSEILTLASGAKKGRVVITGSVGRMIAGLLGVEFINEIAAQAAGVAKFYPKAATVIDMGGQDSKLIFVEQGIGGVKIKDFTLNSVCAAGTGSFLDQQAQRLGVSIEKEFGKLALKSKNPPRIAGRCSVFAKSDMIHLQQQAAPVHDIIAGLCMGLAANLKSNLGRGREFEKPIAFTGGVAANIGVVRAIEKVLHLEENELLVPEQYFFTGAIGAALLAGQKTNGQYTRQIDIESLAEKLRKIKTSDMHTCRHNKLQKPTTLPNTHHKQKLSQSNAPINAYLGVDVGSISTNVVVIDEQKQVLAKVYLMTAGRPLEAVQKGLEIVGEKIADKVRVIGAATTGSGRYLTGDFIGADVVINEITAQATGAAIIEPKVDTIFEIGGQDSKYVSLKNAVVVDFEMNHACAAGTGSFLEEQAQRLGINIKNQFAELAFKSEAPIKLGERCTVFMESDILNFQQQGAETKDLVAGLSYSIVANYLNRVVGRRRIGEHICFQGGTAFNKAVWAAFEQVLGKPVLVPDHHEVLGAIGAAAIAAEQIKSRPKNNGEMIQSKFKGFASLAGVKYNIETFICKHCPNHCEIKQVILPGSEPLCYGSRCDRYNLKKQNKRKPKFDAFAFRRKILFKFAALDSEQLSLKTKEKVSRPRVGIPLALINWQQLPLFARFLKGVGCEVVVSPGTNRKIIRKGVESVSAQMCFPVKVAYGHISELIEQKVDYLFVPSIVSMPAKYPQNEHGNLCPYVQSLPYQIQAVFSENMGQTKILTAPVYLGHNKKQLKKSFVALAGQIGIDKRKAVKALGIALGAQKDFEQACREKTTQILSQLGKDERLFVLISRPYNGCDMGMNLALPNKLADLGAEVIPMDMLDLSGAKLTDASLHEKTYWAYGQDILRTAELIKRDDRLYGIYLSNFSCGPDSFLSSFFKDIMGEKPCLLLELDEHSADAGVITRLEAFLESLKHFKPAPQILASETAKPPENLQPGDKKRTVYIPWMGQSSLGVAAGFIAHGQKAKVLPIADDTTLIYGRRFTSGKECLPCTITIGEMLKLINEKDFKADETAFFMPGGSGPCRFGMYNCLQRLILKQAGVENIPVISPNQDNEFYKSLNAQTNHNRGGSFSKTAWISVIGIDLLDKVILRIRPYARDSRYADLVYQDCIAEWVRAIARADDFSRMRKLMKRITERILTVELDEKVKKPTVGIVGEIYVRNHRFANQDIVRRLEQLGAACELASVAEWIYYTNFSRRNDARLKGDLAGWLENTIANSFQHKIERLLAKPLEQAFGELAEAPIEHTIKYAERYIHRSFGGEAILSVGKIIEYHHRRLGGVVNVMPFTCMPSTIVGTMTTRISDHCNHMPILSLSFDGQQDPTLITRLETFVEQVRQRQNSGLTVSELINAI